MFGKHKVKTPHHVFTDSASGGLCIENRENNKGNKHVDPYYLRSRDWIEEKIFELFHTPGSENPADMMTKPLPPVTFLKLRPSLGLMNL